MQNRAATVRMRIEVVRRNDGTIRSLREPLIGNARSLRYSWSLETWTAFNRKWESGGSGRSGCWSGVIVPKE